MDIGGKRKALEDEEPYVGPSLPIPQKRKVNICKKATAESVFQVLMHAEEYLKQLPCAEMYEKSYMHKDAVTHLAVRL